MVPMLILVNFVTWSGFEAAKTAPWPSLGLHNFGKFFEPSDGCMSWSRMLLLPDAVTWHFCLIRNELQKLVEPNLNFLVLTLSMSLRYFGNELYNRGPNTAIAVS